MSAIKLPVYAYAQADEQQLWSVRDGNNCRICRDITQDQANKIVTELNLHDELVKCLRFSHDALRRASVTLPPHFNNPASCAFTVDTAIQQNETILTRAENPTETKP